MPLMSTALVQMGMAQEMAIFTAILEIPILFPKNILQFSEHTLHSLTAGMGSPLLYRPKPNILRSVTAVLVPTVQKDIAESQV
jgi:hypothetical protein